MISTSIIVFGVCLVVIAIINAIKMFVFDKTLSVYKTASIVLMDSVQKFIDEFNNTYSNTRIKFYLDEYGIPVIEAEDVEPENAE